jgi:hypothetical protein
MAVKQRRTWIVRYEIDFHLAARRHHHDILDDSRRGNTRELSQLE